MPPEETTQALDEATTLETTQNTVTAVNKSVFQNKNGNGGDDDSRGMVDKF